MTKEASRKFLCQHAPEVAAYLDDELDRAAHLRFEHHTAECSSCAAELVEQRRLLCVLDATLNREPDEIRLPKNFAQTIAARAESDMSGVRAQGERTRALWLCAVLAAGAFASLGVAAAAAVAFEPVAVVARALVCIGGMLGHTLREMGTSVAVVLRATIGHFVSEPTPLVLLTWTFFAAAVVLLLRLISSYRHPSVPIKN